MKINMSNPRSGLQKCLEVDDEKKLLPFFEKRMGAEVAGDSIGAEFEGYLFRISGGNDKQGFPMMQGVLANHRVRLLFSKGMSGYRPRRKGEKKRKSIRGCIVGPDLAVLNLVLVKKGAGEIPGLTDGEKPRRLGPKRASHIRRLFNLGKEDVRRFVVRRQLEGKKKTKAPRIQRLITKTRLQRKRHDRKVKREFAINSRAKAEAYKQLLTTYRAEVKEKKAHHLEAMKKKKGLASSGAGRGAEGAKESAAAKPGAAAAKQAKKVKKVTTTTTTSTKSAAQKKGGGAAAAGGAAKGGSSSSAAGKTK